MLASVLVDRGSAAPGTPFTEELFQGASSHLEHQEPRVRGLVAKLLGSLARSSDGVSAYDRFEERLVGSIKDNFERTTKVIPDVVSGDKDVAVDDTTGWKALETSVLAMQQFVEAIGRPFVDNGTATKLSPELVHYIVSGATKHVNRHVREASLKLIASIIDVSGVLEGEGAPSQGDALTEAFSKAIIIGLQDNWSQVRYAASVANRSLLGALPKEARNRLYPTLLPRMCLNRYYLAEGVKLYSQATWEMFMDGEGPAVVAAHADAVVAYYIEMTEANNHVVREGACHCIAEMAMKIDKDPMKGHVPSLLNALLACFHDESWPVRDAACVASGRFAAAYPAQCQSSLERLYERWFVHLCEPIWSVREDSAIALGLVCKAYGDEAVTRCQDWLSANLNKAKDQPAQTREEHKALANDAAAHTDQQRYSCGSLAPKLKKGGCSDCEVTRPSMPWEYTDGGIYLIKELCAVAPSVATGYFEDLAALAKLSHFPQADTLRETLWRQLPQMARVLGKKPFKAYLELFLDPIFSTLTWPGQHQLAQHAAGDCLQALSTFIGPGIFRGRLSEEQAGIMDSSPHCQPGIPPGGIGMAPWAAVGTPAGQ
ncbi:unnamed protein product [Chrysoparadoxa australica]